MTIKTAIYSYLISQPAIISAVSSRVYPGTVPTSADFPYIAYYIISSESVHHQRSASAISRTRIQFDCMGSTSLDAEEVSEALRFSLDGYRGLMSGLDINVATKDGDYDDFVSPTDKSQVGVHRRVCDYLIWHYQSVGITN